MHKAQRTFVLIFIIVCCVLSCFINYLDTNYCVLGNSSEYFINNVKFTLAKYLEQLEMVGIVSKAQNCLVFQVNLRMWC